MEVTLIINSGDLERQVTLGAAPLTLGRGEDCGLPLPGDRGLSRRHATIRHRDDRVLLTDGGSTNGSFVNGRRVTERGTELSDGDEIRIGHSTVIAVRIKRPRAATQVSQAAPRTAVPLSVRLAVLSVVMIALSGVGFLLYSLTPRPGDSVVTNMHPASTPIVNNLVDKTPTPTPTPTPATPTPTPEAVTTPTPEVASLPAQPAVPPTAGGKDEGGRRPRLYRSMTREQKAEFIRQRAQHVSIMMSGRPYAMPPEALDLIQYWLDAFASRVGNRRRGLWGGDTIYIFERGKTHAPVIMRAFRDHNVPVVIGLYIPFIETEYTNISSNNHAGAAGLFQFLGDTAEGYGVPRAERTNVPRMSVAAARYFRDNIVTFGDGPMGVALSIAGYNRAPESVKRDLRNILNMESNARERSFWTLVANQGKLDKWFQQENRNYVPRFFAAAIIGETPWAFGIEMRALSTYTEPGGDGAAAPPPPER